jgi:hypothetical protein
MQHFFWRHFFVTALCFRSAEAEDECEEEVCQPHLARGADSDGRGSQPNTQACERALELFSPALLSSYVCPSRL